MSAHMTQPALFPYMPPAVEPMKLTTAFLLQIVALRLADAAARLGDNELAALSSAMADAVSGDLDAAKDALDEVWFQERGA